MGKKLMTAKKLDYHAPRGDRLRISLALLLSSVALMLSDVLLLLGSLGVHHFALWLSVSVLSFALLFFALAILLKEIFRNRFFSAVLNFIVSLLITAACIAVTVVTHTPVAA